MTQNEVKRQEYSLIGFDDYTVTDGGKVFRLRHFKHKTDRVEVKEDTQGLVPLYIGKQRVYRCSMEKIVCAATSGLDPRSKEVEQLMKDKLRDSLLPTLSERVNAVSKQKDDIRIKQKELMCEEISDWMLCELRSKDMVTDGAKGLANMAAHLAYRYYEVELQIDRESMTEIKTTTKGHEVREAHHLAEFSLKLVDRIMKLCTQLGLDYSALQKQVTITARKVPELFDDAEEVDDIINNIDNLV